MSRRHSPCKAAPLPEGELPSDHQRPDGTHIYSLTAHALACIARHRWIESEKHAQDCGKKAEEDWINRFWSGWARSKLLEHLMGWRCWGAFGDDCFALFRRQSLAEVVDEQTILEIGIRLAGGSENLDIVNWAVENNRDLDAVIALLDRIDINAKRQRLLTKHIRLFI